MSIKKQFGISTAWMSLAASSNSFVSFLIFIYLSRLLSPKDIGLMAFSIIVIDIGRLFVTGGLTQAIIQKKRWDRIYASTCFALNIIYAGTAALAIFFIIAPLIAKYYDPHSEEIIKTLSVILFAEAIKAVPEGKLKRAFLFKIIAFRSIFAGIISGVVGIFLAMRGHGVYALVGQQITNHVLVMIVTTISAKWLPSFVFSKNFAISAFSFSSPLMAAQLVANVGFNIFEMLIGLIIGPLALGFYRVGGRALYILQDIILKPFETTALSALSRVIGLEAQANATLRMLRLSTFIIFPVFFGAAAIGSKFIVIAFGEKWSQSGAIMTILALGVAPSVIFFSIDAAIASAGRSNLVMRIAVLGFVLNTIVAFLCIPYGVLAAAWAFSLKNYFFSLLHIFYFDKIFNIGFVNVFRVVIPNFLCSLIMFFILMLLQELKFLTTDPIFEILILCFFGVLIQISLCVVFFRKDARNFFDESFEMIPPRFQPALKKIRRFL